MATLSDYQEVTFPRTGHEAATARLRNALTSLTRIGNKNTHEHWELFCMMFFFASSSDISRPMLRFAQDALSAWRGAGADYGDAVLIQQMAKLEALMYERDGISDYGVHNIAVLGSKTPSMGLLNAISARFAALEDKYKDAPVQTHERVRWTRKIRIKGREV